LRFGNGPKSVICFHGYGETANHFAFFENTVLAAEYTFLAFDLPFHGESKWENDSIFTVDDLNEIVSLCIDQFPAQKRAGSKITLIGFSLGGRVALSLYELIPGKVERLILLAPDGLKLNFWYWLSTQTLLGMKVFSYTMKHPAWFFALLNILNKLKLVNSSIFKFVRYYVDDAEARNILYQRWIVLRKLRPSISSIKKKIRSNSTITRLVYGKHDRIILPVRGEKFQSGIEENCQISIIHSGHQVLHERHVAELIPTLLQ
jgi:pimeloyl-ACP methyl ester carboxylesterase